MEVKDKEVRTQPAPADKDARVIEAEQTEIAVQESLLEIRYA